MITKRIFLIFVISIVFYSCSQKSEDPITGYVYDVPPQLTDGWMTASLIDVGMDTAPFIRLMNDLLYRDDHYIHGILIVKNGYLVFEEYFSGNDLDIMDITGTGVNLNLVYKDFDSQGLHFQASATKSVTSILVGIAIDNGLIKGIDESMFSFFPEHADLMDEQKNTITIHHMLAMCSGLSWDESTYPYDDPRSDTYQFIISEDPIRFMLSKEIVTTPGTAFHYNSGTTNILGDIVRKTSGLILTEFARQNLFEPLGIDTFDWRCCSIADQVTFASGGLYLRPRAMAKIGQMYLQEGMWNGTRIVSAEWIRESTREYMDITPYNPLPLFAWGYGYQWWLGTYAEGNTHGYLAGGWGDQFIIILPGVEMVVVMTGGAYYDDSPFPVYFTIVNDYILPSII